MNKQVHQDFNKTVAPNTIRQSSKIGNNAHVYIVCSKIGHKSLPAYSSWVSLWGVLPSFCTRNKSNIMNGSKLNELKLAVAYDLHKY
jgi:hypothetical protein